MLLLLCLLLLLRMLLRYRVRRRRSLRLSILSLRMLVVVPVVRSIMGVLVGEDVVSLHGCDTACKPARVAF